MSEIQVENPVMENPILEPEAAPASSYDKFVGNLIKVVSVLFVLFIFYSALFGSLNSTAQYALCFAVVSSLIFLMKPLPGRFKVIDWALIAITLFVTGYIVVFMMDIAWRVGRPTDLDVLVSILGTLITLEITRRTNGWTLVIIASITMLYSRFGHMLNNFLAHSGFGWDRIMVSNWLAGNGVFGTCLIQMANFVFLFIIFGVMLQHSGGGQFLMDIAFSMAKHSRSGPAQTSVIASSFFGMISSNAVANVTTTGVYTIPLMKQNGYSSHFAGAVEAAISTGSQFIPPVMGISAFIIAELLSIPFKTVVIAAILPAALYCISISISVHLEACRLGLQKAKADEVPDAGKIIRKDWAYFVPPLVLLACILLGYSPAKSAMLAIACIFVVGFIKKTIFFTWTSLSKYFTMAVKDSLTLWAVCAVIGIVIVNVTMTGVGVKFTSLVMKFGGDNLLVALLLTMLASFVLGMGLPTPAAYILIALTSAPALVAIGLPPLSAHLFCFYFAIISNITPPVALASYTAAAIAGAGLWETSVDALRIGAAAFLVPFAFCFNPGLIMGLYGGNVPLSFATALVGVFALALSCIGYGMCKLNIFERAALFACAVWLTLTNAYNIVPLLLVFLIFGRPWIVRKLKERKHAQA